MPYLLFFWNDHYLSPRLRPLLFIFIICDYDCALDSHICWFACMPIQISMNVHVDLKSITLGALAVGCGCVLGAIWDILDGTLAFKVGLTMMLLWGTAFLILMTERISGTPLKSQINFLSISAACLVVASGGLALIIWNLHSRNGAMNVARLSFSCLVLWATGLIAEVLIRTPRTPPPPS